MTWLTGYGYRKKLTISHSNVDEVLTDFPLLVKIADDTDIGANALPNGHDIRFTASDGSTVLSHEREDFAVADGEVTGDFWVKVPSVSDTADTDIYIYYGKADAEDGNDPTNVWDENFKGVYHLGETGTGAAGDYNAMTHQADGCWTITLTNPAGSNVFLDGVLYLEYAKESGDLHVAGEGRLLRGKAVVDDVNASEIGGQTANQVTITDIQTWLAPYMTYVVQA